MTSELKQGDAVDVKATAFGKRWAKATYPDSWKTEVCHGTVKTVPAAGSSSRCFHLAFEGWKGLWRVKEEDIIMPSHTEIESSAPGAASPAPQAGGPVVVADWDEKPISSLEQDEATTVPGPSLHIQDPTTLSRAELFFQLLPVEFIEAEVLPATNQCGRIHHSTQSPWKDISFDEFRIFLGAIMMLSVFPGPWKSLWSTSPSVPDAARVPATKMSRDCFEAILSSLRLRRSDAAAAEVSCGLESHSLNLRVEAHYPILFCSKTFSAIL